MCFRKSTTARWISNRSSLFTREIPFPIIYQGDSNNKKNKATGRNLKGSRKLQVDFSGGFVTGFGAGGGSVIGAGEAKNLNASGISSASGGGNFTSSGGASAFLITRFGTANGSGGGRASGSQLGSALAMTGLGLVSFTGTSYGDGAGGFGAGLSPVQFNTTTTIVGGTAIPGVSGKKNGAATFSEPTTTVTVTSVSTGPTGGFGFGLGSLDISSTSTGTLMGANAEGVGSSVGSVTTFRVGVADAANYFGKSRGLGLGADTGTATGEGTTKFDLVNGMFSSTGTTLGNFTSQGSGIFGTPGALTFP
jgi:hypothetical protein